MSPLASIAHFFKTGGPFMYAVFIAALTILALVAERFWVIARAGNINTEKLTKDVLARVAKGDMAGLTVEIVIVLAKLAHWNSLDGGQASDE